MAIATSIKLQPLLQAPLQLPILLLLWIYIFWRFDNHSQCDISMVILKLQETISCLNLMQFINHQIINSPTNFRLFCKSNLLWTILYTLYKICIDVKVIFIRSCQKIIDNIFCWFWRIVMFQIMKNDVLLGGELCRM
jgi:hypothetical protein